MPFEKGQSGNPGGLLSKQTKPFLEALNRAIAQNDAVKLRKAAETLLDKAAEGEPWAVQMLADRLDGKAVQAVTGPDGGALIAVIERRIVRPTDSNG